MLEQAEQGMMILLKARSLRHNHLIRQRCRKWGEAHWWFPDFVNKLKPCFHLTEV